MFVLVSRGSHSGGQLVSQCLQRQTNLTCLNREDLIESVNRHGELANRITAAIPKATRDYGSFSALRRPYKILMRLALLEYARRGPIAYFGYSGHLLIQGIAHVLRVRIIAPIETRIKLLMEREPQTEEQARSRIHEADEERSRWTHFMYAKTLRDPECFDLCINLGRISCSTACCTILSLTKSCEFTATPESLAALENQYLSNCVLAALATNVRTSDLEIGAVADNGRIKLEGSYLEKPALATVLEIVNSVPGVTHVEYTEGYALPLELDLA